MHGYPYLYRMFPFENRPVQLLAGFLGINTSPAFSPDGKSVALTLSKDGNPEVYLLNLATGAFRRLTSNAAIDTEPTLVADRPRDRLRLRARGAGARLRDGRGGRERAAAHPGRVQHPAALVAQGRHHRLHLATGQPRSLGDQPRRVEPAPAHRGPRQQRGRLVGAERPAPRLPVEPARAATSSSRCSPTDRSSSCSRGRPGELTSRCLVAAPSVIR